VFSKIVRQPGEVKINILISSNVFSNVVSVIENGNRKRTAVPRNSEGDPHFSPEQVLNCSFKRVSVDTVEIKHTASMTLLTSPSSVSCFSNLSCDRLNLRYCPVVCRLSSSDIWHFLLLHSNC